MIALRVVFLLPFITFVLGRLRAVTGAGVLGRLRTVVGLLYFSSVFEIILRLSSFDLAVRSFSFTLLSSELSMFLPVVFFIVCCNRSIIPLIGFSRRGLELIVTTYRENIS